MNKRNNNTGFPIFWLIPVLVLGYIGWMNLMPLGGIATHFIDVGGEDIGGRAKITGPFDRISDKKENAGISFRELQKSLVYFELDDRKLNFAAGISVRVRFRDDFPENTGLTIGAKNAEEWSYLWKDSYTPFLRKLETLPLLAKDEVFAIYATRQVDTDIRNVDEFLRSPPLGSVIATNDKGLNINQRIGEEHLAGIDWNKFTTAATSSNNADTGASGSLHIKTALRGSHTLWTQVTNGLLALEVAKQDLNWYEGPDVLTVEVYSIDGEMLGDMEIPDDGDEIKTNQIGQLQYDILYISADIEPSTYRIELKANDDMLISEIAINQAKLVVANRIFPVGMNRAYFKGGVNLEPLKLYGKYPATSEVRFRTSHSTGLQRVTVTSNDLSTEFDINETNTDFKTSLKPGDYEFDVPEQNVIIETKGYFSFTPESFFLPQRCSVVNLKYDMRWLKESVDYVVMNYKDYAPPVVDTGDWLIGQTSWKTKDLYIVDDKLSFCLNVAHLVAQPERVAAIDWIEITLKIPPIWERLRWIN